MCAMGGMNDVIKKPIMKIRNLVFLSGSQVVFLASSSSRWSSL